MTRRFGNGLVLSALWVIATGCRLPVDEDSEGSAPNDREGAGLDGRLDPGMRSGVGDDARDPAADGADVNVENRESASAVSGTTPVEIGDPDVENQNASTDETEGRVFALPAAGILEAAPVADDYLVLDQASLVEVGPGPGLRVNADDSVLVFGEGVNKYDASFRPIWEMDDIVIDAIGAEDGSTYITRTIFDPGTATNIVVAKLDASGSLLWEDSFGGSAPEQPVALALGPDNSVYVTGWTQGQLPGQSPDLRGTVFLARYDAGGNQLFLKQLGQFPDPYSTLPNFINLTSVSAMNISHLGEVYLSSGSSLLGKFNATGQPLWYVKSTTPVNPVDPVRLVKMDGDGNLLGDAELSESSLYPNFSMMGLTPGGGGFGVSPVPLIDGISTRDYRVVLSRFDDSGSIEWMRQYESQSEEIDPVEGVIWTKRPFSLEAIAVGTDTVAVVGTYQHIFANGAVQRPQRNVGFVAQYDETGRLDWFRQVLVDFGNPDQLGTLSITGVGFRSNGDVIALGDGREAVLLRFSPDGNLL